MRRTGGRAGLPGRVKWPPRGTGMTVLTYPGSAPRGTGKAARDLSDPWTGFTQFTLLEEKAPDGYMWSGERLTREQLTSRPDHLWPELWKSMGKHAKLKEEQKWSNETSILKTHENCEGSISSTPRIRNSKKPSRTRVKNWKHQWLLLCPVKL